MGDRNSRVCTTSTGWLRSQKSFVVIEQPFNKDQMPQIRKCGISSQQTPSPGDPMIPQRPPWPSEPEVHRSLELPMLPSLLACIHGFHNTWIIFQDLGLQTELPPVLRAYLPGSNGSSGVGVYMPNVGLGQ